MPDVALNEVYCVRFIARMGDQISVNVRYYRINLVEPAGGLTWQELANELATTAALVYTPIMSSAATFEGVSIQRIEPAPVQAVIYSERQGAAGEVTGDPLPPQTCGLLSMRADYPGRRAYQRAYLPFPSETHSGTDGRPVPAYVAACSAVSDLFGFIEFALGGDIPNTELVGVAKPDPALTGTGRLVSSRLRPGWATQRRRSYFGRSNLSPF